MMVAFKPAGRIYQDSVMVEDKIYFLGGLNGANIGTSDLFYLDISSPFSSVNLKWTDLTSVAPIPVKSAFAPACIGGNKNSTIYLFEHHMTDNVNSTTLVTFAFDITTQKWYVQSTSGITPPPRQNLKVVVDMNGKIYISGGFEPYITLKSSNSTYIFNSLSNSWLKGSVAPLIRSANTATLLPSGHIVYIGGTHDFPNGTTLILDYRLAEIDMNQTATGATIGTRLSHSAVLSNDGFTIIIYGGGSENFTATPEPSLAALDTRVTPYRWSKISSTGTFSPPPLAYHSAQIVKNFMIVAFGALFTTNGFNLTTGSNDNVYILDTSNHTWITSFDLTNHNSSNPSSKLHEPQFNIPLIASLSSGLFGLIIFASILAYIFYRKHYNYIATPGTNTGDLNYIPTPGSDTGDRNYIATPGTDTGDRNYIATSGTNDRDHEFDGTLVPGVITEMMAESIAARDGAIFMD
ncbi:5263_t:CDS:2, partial [Dentiscutata erythropus]